jgi:hypothetical protein
MQSEARVADDQPATEDDVLSAEADDAEAETEAEDAETDDSVPRPIDEDDKIEEIDDLI